ncbi:MAG: M16 family metallopeptidase [Chloroflexota bacterium]
MTAFGTSSALLAVPYVFATLSLPMAAMPSEAPGGADSASTVLANGIVVLTRERKGADVIALQVLVGSGARDEADDQAGASKLWEQLMTQGTPTRPTPGEVLRHFSITGGMIGTRATWETFWLSTIARGPDFPEALNVLSDILLNSGTTDEFVERGRRISLDDVARRKNAPARWIRDVQVEELYGRELARRTPAGDPESLQSLTPSALRRFHAEHFRGGNMIVAVVGNISHEDAVSQVSAALGGVPAGARPSRVPLPPLQAKPIWKEIKAGTDQAEVVLSVPAVGRLHPDYYPLLIYDRIMGLPSGPLFGEVRDRYGLAYSVGSGITAFRETGDWSISAGTAAGNAERLRDIALDQVRSMRDERITQASVDAIKTYLLGTFVVGLEQYSDDAMALAQLAWNGQTLDDHRAKIRAVTADDVQRVVRTYLDPDKFLAVVLRP